MTGLYGTRIKGYHEKLREDNNNTEQYKTQACEQATAQDNLVSLPFENADSTSAPFTLPFVEECISHEPEAYFGMFKKSFALIIQIDPAPEHAALILFADTANTVAIEERQPSRKRKLPNDDYLLSRDIS